MGIRRFLQCVGFALFSIYTCFIFLFAIFFISLKLKHGELTNVFDLVFCIATWPLVIIITGALIWIGFGSQKDRLICILGSIGLLVLSVYVNFRTF